MTISRPQTAADELRAAADVLWDRSPDLDAEPMSVERHPRSWALVLMETASHAEAGGRMDATRLAALGTARSILTPTETAHG